MNTKSEIMHKLIDLDYELSLSEIFRDTFKFFMSNLGLFVSYTLISLIVVGLVGWIIPMGQFLLFFFLPALMAGPTFYTLWSLDQDVEMQKTSHDISFSFPEKSLYRFFDSFKHTWPLLVISTISGALISLGFIFLILPGIYLLVAYSIYECVYYDFRLSFWDTLEISRKIVGKRWPSWFLILTLGTILGYGGVILLGVGILVTLPFSTCLHIIAYQKIREQLLKGVVKANPRPLSTN